jgi:hypothetical protein
MDAGPKKASAVPNTADIAISSASWRLPLAMKTAIAPTAKPRTASETSITSLLGTRSTTPPPPRARHTAGIARAARTKASPVGL